jgi:DNA modification methylase
VTNWEILEGDAFEQLADLESKSVQTCITSPPYWGLRDYGHSDQLGLERTPEAYTEKLVAVFREVRHVLRDDGTLWLNLGDSYAASSHSVGRNDANRRGSDGFTGSANPDGYGGISSTTVDCRSGLKPKDLVGIPWRVAFALQADGWYLRSDIIWAKPNPMPESVTDRPTKSPTYYYDAGAIATRAINAGGIRRQSDNPGTQARGSGRIPSGNQKPNSVTVYADTRNRRTVWTIPTQPFPGAHFAVFPPALVEPCILAGSREGDLILDPFAGSGTVGVVCRKHSRRFVGIELSPDYAAMARGRLGGDVTEAVTSDEQPSLWSVG